jgi:D-alanine-D-alanine ligase
MTKKIALITGGYSGEAEVSYKTTVTIAHHLDPEKWTVYRIDIRKEGWFYTAPDGSEISIDKNDFSLSYKGETIRFDAVLTGLHGTPGEDGKLPGYFDMLGIPYTCCDAATSALTFNKRYTVAVAAFAGLKVARSIHLFRHHPVSTETILETLRLPVFVKPNNGGSSIGMSKVTEADSLPAAIARAFAEDDQVLVEEEVKGREFTIGVFRNKGEIITLPITEIISKKDFFDYEAKYQGASEEVTPALLPETIAAAIREAARKTYAVFNCKGVVRIDYIYNEAEGQPYMLEVNTVPGQTDASIVPQQVRAMGWTLRDFYSALLEECLGI